MRELGAADRNSQPLNESPGERQQEPSLVLLLGETSARGRLHASNDGRPARIAGHRVEAVRVVWDVTPLSVPPTGIGRYIRETLSAAAGIAPEHEFVALALTGRNETRRIGPELDRLPATVARRHRRLRGALVVRKIVNSTPVPFLETLAGRADAFVGSEWLYPRQRAGVHAAVVHDLVPIRFPRLTTKATRRMHLAKVADVKRADVVFCNSHATARDVETLLGVDPARVRVARPGVSDDFRFARANGQGPADGRPYVLAVGMLEPRKNIPTLLEAHARLRVRHPELALVLVGAKGWGGDVITERAEELRLGDALVRTGYVPEETLPSILAGARVFCFPSLYEGFGIPIAEALAAGVPVVASDHPSLDEVSGDAALRVPPLDPGAVADGIERLLFDHEERDRRIRAGRAHVAQLTWDTCARTIVSGLEEVAGCRRSAS